MNNGFSYLVLIQMSHGDLTVLHILYFSLHNDINCKTFRIIFKLFPIYLYRKRKLYNYIIDIMYIQ